MTTSRQVDDVATATGFRAEIVEKVLRLTAVRRRQNDLRAGRSVPREAYGRHAPRRGPRRGASG